MNFSDIDKATLFNPVTTGQFLSSDENNTAYLVKGFNFLQGMAGAAYIFITCTGNKEKITEKLAEEIKSLPKLHAKETEKLAAKLRWFKTSTLNETFAKGNIDDDHKAIAKLILGRIATIRGKSKEWEAKYLLNSPEANKVTSVATATTALNTSGSTQSENEPTSPHSRRATVIIAPDNEMAALHQRLFNYAGIEQPPNNAPPPVPTSDTTQSQPNENESKSLQRKSGKAILPKDAAKEMEEMLKKRRTKENLL